MTKKSRIVVRIKAVKLLVLLVEGGELGTAGHSCNANTLED